MLLRIGKPLGALAVMLGFMASGAYLYRRSASADWERRYAEYQRQLQGRLTEREKEVEALNTQLGLARSQLVTQETLERKYQSSLAKRDDALEQFRREHALRVESLSDANFLLQQQLRQGEGKAQAVLPSPASLKPGADAAQPVISYHYADKEGRLQLTDPDIGLPGDEVVELTQRFRVKGTVLRQEDGALMTERLQLLEVARASDGTYRELAEAHLVDASFSYVNAPLESQPPPGGHGLAGMVTVGTSLRAQGRLRFGASARLVRLGAWGLAAGLSSDLASWEGSGGDAFVIFTPSREGRELALALGGGVHLPAGGAARVVPSLTLNFVVYP